MALYTWNEAWSVNVAPIDAQHRHLFDLANELHQAVSEGRGRERLEAILTAMIEHAESHFETEERLMREHGYEGYARHRRVHRDLLDQLSCYRSAVRDGSSLATVQIRATLDDWVTHHLQGEDHKLGPFLAARGVR